MRLTFEEIAEIIANQAHTLLLSQEGGPLDGDQVDEFSVIFKEELNKLNGNT